MVSVRLCSSLFIKVGGVVSVVVSGLKVGWLLVSDLV